jgi:hypothetical protein
MNNADAPPMASAGQTSQSWRVIENARKMAIKLNSPQKMTFLRPVLFPEYAGGERPEHARE